MKGTSTFIVKQTESCRLMRGAWEAYWEYIPELCTKYPRGLVGCNAVARVINARVS